MSVIASKFYIVLDRGVCCVGHGKSIVDTINGTDKNTILRMTGRQVKEAALGNREVDNESNIHKMKSSKTALPAEDCIKILKKEYSNVQRKKRVKKEGRTISKQFWHLKKFNQQLNMSKYDTIKFDEEGTIFNDMYHFYACKDLGVGFVAMKRVPCYYEKCNETLKRPWVHRVHKQDQPQFESATDYFFSSVVGDKNK